jgi:hypothetical protein
LHIFSLALEMVIMALSVEAAAAADIPPIEQVTSGLILSPTEDIDLVLSQHHRLQYEVSRYIETILGELRTIAHAASLQHLQYFLELSRQEAHDQTQRCRKNR